MSKGHDKSTTVAVRYANALITIAVQNNMVEKIRDDFGAISDLVTQNKGIYDFFTSPVVTVSDKKEIIDLSFKDKVEMFLYVFLNMLIDKNRFYLIPVINQIIKEKAKELANILEVETVTSITLYDDIKKALTEKLNKLLNKKIELKTTTADDIIGGVVLKYKDKVIDGSIKTKLEKIEKQLI